MRYRFLYCVHKWYGGGHTYGTVNGKKSPFWDESLTIEERLDWLLRTMTQDEKLQCLATRVPDMESTGVKGFGVGATWDTELIQKAGEVVGKETRVIYHRHPDRGLSRWAPTVDLERDPRWGRTEEGYGEDPLLTGAMAGAYVRGMQGEHPRYLRVAATLKHFYGNNTEEGRVYKSSSIDPRNRMELYLEPFRRVAVIGPLADMWYQDWYGGTPFYKKTLRQGICEVTGKEVPCADGWDRVVFWYQDKGVAIAKDGALCLSDEPDVFIKNDWGNGSFTFQSVRTGKYMNAEKEAEKDGQEGPDDRAVWKLHKNRRR